MICGMFPMTAFTMPEMICGIAETMVVMICGRACTVSTILYR